MRVPARQIQQQLESVLTAWGMSAAHAATTAQMMVETDLRGVDCHGISMLPTYDKEFRAGRLNMRPQWKTVRDMPSMARIDADRSLGHPVSAHAMNLAVDKCLTTGVAVVAGVQLAPLRRGRLLREDRGRSRGDRDGHVGHPRRHAGAHLRGGAHHWGRTRSRSRRPRGGTRRSSSTWPRPPSRRAR